jgi:hypothetical protein
LRPDFTSGYILGEIRKLIGFAALRFRNISKKCKKKGFNRLAETFFNLPS